jgi:hypothetical protein
MKPFKFCHTCGHELKVTPIVYAYHGHSGEEQITYIYECPNDITRWWKPWIQHPKTEGEAYADQVG